jgi:outer membrane protein assembly factor BamE (lipoprotein component of BamABCDE complex)
VSKRALIILGIVVLGGTWLMVVGYEFLQKENALWQQKVKTAKEEQQRCAARYSKYRNFDQFRTSIRLPYTSDLSVERWMQHFNTLRAGMSESEVEIVMGAPDYAYCGINKEGDKFMGSVWTYQIAVPQALGRDDQNSTIAVNFDPDGKLKDKDAVNMQPKPSPTATVAAPTPTGTASPAAQPEQSAPPAISPQQAPAGTVAPSPMQQPTPPATATPSPAPQT